ncbi:MAG: hypothetical protein AB7O44_29920 [Hyphomicrobiaceae bacterium]
MVRFFDSDKAVVGLGKTMTEDEQVIEGINNSLGHMWDFAKANGLDTTAIERFKETQIVDYAKNFMAQFSNKSPLEAALEALEAHEAEKAGAIKNAQVPAASCSSQMIDATIVPGCPRRCRRASASYGCRPSGSTPIRARNGITR